MINGTFRLLRPRPISAGPASPAATATAQQALLGGLAFDSAVAELLRVHTIPL
jgi:hypothetical protein